MYIKRLPCIRFGWKKKSGQPVRVSGITYGGHRTMAKADCHAAVVACGNLNDVSVTWARCVDFHQSEQDHAVLFGTRWFSYTWDNWILLVSLGLLLGVPSIATWWLASILHTFVSQFGDPVLCFGWIVMDSLEFSDRPSVVPSKN